MEWQYHHHDHIHFVHMYQFIAPPFQFLWSNTTSHQYHPDTHTCVTVPPPTRIKLKNAGWYQDLFIQYVVIVNLLEKFVSELPIIALVYILCCLLLFVSKNPKIHWAKKQWIRNVLLIRYIKVKFKFNWIAIP